MRASALPILFLLSAACGDDSLTVSGSLVPESGATEVYVLGGAERATVRADSFRLSGLEGDTLELRFAAGEEEPARMLIVGLPESGEVWLEGIWLSNGVAFPARVRAKDDEPVTVNGFRMGGLSPQVDVAGTVLAASREGDALLVRPHDTGLPDLRVVITPGTVVRREDGEPGETDGLESGDSLRVAGQGVEGYVVATEVVLPRGRDE